jgi:Cu+-exporting ATPase
MLAAAAMALSSLSVVSNANRLRRYHSASLPPAALVRVEPRVEIGADTRNGSATSPALPAAGALHSQGSARHVHVPGGDGHEHHGHRDGEGMVTDPVCGMRVSAATAQQRRDSSGEPVWFCSAHCAAAFDADPHRYHAATPGGTP